MKKSIFVRPPTVIRSAWCSGRQMMRFGLPTHANDEASKTNRTGYYYISCDISYPLLYTLQSALFVQNLNKSQSYIRFYVLWMGWDWERVMAFLLVILRGGVWQVFAKYILISQRKVSAFLYLIEYWIKYVPAVPVLVLTLRENVRSKGWEIEGVVTTTHTWNCPTSSRSR